MMPLLSHKALLKQLHLHVKDVVDRNQNPNCGGDREMSAEQWTHLRDISQSLHEVVIAISQVVKDCNPPMLGNDDQCELV